MKKKKPKSKNVLTTARRSRPREGFLPFSAGMGIGGGVEAVVGGLADEVDAEGDESDAEAGRGVPQLAAQHRVLPPLVPPLEELRRFPHRRLRHLSLSRSRCRPIPSWRGW